MARRAFVASILGALFFLGAAPARALVFHSTGIAGLVPPFFIAQDSVASWESAAGAGWVEMRHNTTTAGNSGNWYNSGTGRFTAPVTGVYLCMATQYTSIGVTYQHFDIGVNGNPVTGGGRANSSYQIDGYAAAEGSYGISPSVVRILSLTAGDYTSVFSYMASAGSYRYAQYSTFSCILMR